MKINEYVASLGNTAEEVAASLRKQGAKGVPDSEWANPVIAGIYLHCDTWSGLRLVGVKGAKPSARFTFADCQIGDPANPHQAVTDFLIRFNTGAFSDLVDPTLARMKNGYEQSDWIRLNAKRLKADAASIVQGY